MMHPPNSYQTSTFEALTPGPLLCLSTSFIRCNKVVGLISTLEITTLLVANDALMNFGIKP